jgi:hypothetical protein
MTKEERERLHKEWYALRDACSDYHHNKKRGGGGPGGARVCVCGAGCGGSTACSMLSELRSMIRYADPVTAELGGYHKAMILALQGIV